MALSARDDDPNAFLLVEHVLFHDPHLLYSLSAEAFCGSAVEEGAGMGRRRAREGGVQLCVVLLCYA